jgi:hypothetical protein
MNRYFLEDRDPDAARVYDGFWRHGGSEEHMPEPSPAVKEALAVLASGTAQQPVQYSQVDEYMKRAAPYVEIFRSATQSQEYCLEVKPDPEMPLTGAIFPSLACGENALLVLLARAWKEPEGKLSKLHQAWIAGFNHARHLGDAKSGLTVARANSVRMVIYPSMLSAVERGLLTGEGFVKTLELLRSADRTHPKLTGAIYLAWADQLALVQALYPSGRLNRVLAQQIATVDQTGSVRSLDVSAMRKSYNQLGAIVCELDKYFIRLLGLSRQPIRIAAIQKIRELRAKLNRGAVASHPLRPILFYDPTSLYRNQLRATAMRRAVVLVLMLHDFHGRHGEWPDTLGTLKMPASLEFMVDPFSESHFIYQRVGDSFLLYTVGEDQMDNSGKHGAWSTWYPAQAGTDFVFWPLKD